MEARRRTTITQRIDEELVPPGQALLFEQYRILRKSWYWVLIASLLVTAGIYFYVSEFVEPEFLAVAEIVPPRKTSTPLDNLLGDVASGLKSISISKIIGRKGDESGYSAFSILTSTPVLDSLVEKHDLYTVYEIPRDRPDLMLGALSGNIEYETTLEGPMSVSVYDTDPERAAAMANDAVRFANRLLFVLNKRETEPITRFIEERYADLQREQTELSGRLEAVMKRTNIYEPEAQLPATSTALVEARVEESSQRAMLGVLERSLGEDDPQVIELRTLLQETVRQREKLERGGAGVGPGVGSMPAALLEYARLRQDYEVNAQVLALIEPMYEQTRFDENRNIPQLIFLHEASPPPIKARPSRGLAAISGFVGTIILSYILIALVAFLRSFNARYRSYQEVTEQMLTQSDSRLIEEASLEIPNDQGEEEG